MKDAASGMTLSVLKSKVKDVFLTHTFVKTVSNFTDVLLQKVEKSFFVCLIIGADVP